MAGFLKQCGHNCGEGAHNPVTTELQGWADVGCGGGGGESKFSGKSGEGGVSGGFTKCGWFLEIHRSAGQIPYGSHQFVVGGMRVAHRRGQAFVPRETLGQADVLGGGIQICARAMPQAVIAEGTLKSSPLLPQLHQRANLPGGESGVLLAHEQGRIGIHGLPCCAFPGGVFLELEPQAIRQHNLLHSSIGVAALVDAKHDAPSWPIARVKHIAHVEGDDFVFAKAGGEGHTKKHVVPKAGLVLSSCLEQLGLLALGQSPRGNGDSRVVAHGRIHALAGMEFKS